MNASRRPGRALRRAEKRILRVRLDDLRRQERSLESLLSLGVRDSERRTAFEASLVAVRREIDSLQGRRAPGNGIASPSVGSQDTGLPDQRADVAASGVSTFETPDVAHGEIDDSARPAEPGTDAEPAPDQRTDRDPAGDSADQPTGNEHVSDRLRGEVIATADAVRSDDSHDEVPHDEVPSTPVGPTGAPNAVPPADDLVSDRYGDRFDDVAPLDAAGQIQERSGSGGATDAAEDETSTFTVFDEQTVEAAEAVALDDGAVAELVERSRSVDDGERSNADDVDTSSVVPDDPWSTPQLSTGHADPVPAESRRKRRAAIRQTRRQQRINDRLAAAEKRSARRLARRQARLRRREERRRRREERARHRIARRQERALQAAVRKAEERAVKERKRSEKVASRARRAAERAAAKQARRTRTVPARDVIDPVTGPTDHGGVPVAPVAPVDQSSTFPERVVESVPVVAPLPDDVPVDELREREQQARSDRLAAEADLAATRRQLEVERQRVQAERENTRAQEEKAAEAAERIEEMERARLVKSSRASARADLRNARNARRRARVEAFIVGRANAAVLEALQQQARSADQRILNVRTVLDRGDDAIVSVYGPDAAYDSVDAYVSTHDSVVDKDPTATHQPRDLSVDGGTNLEALTAVDDALGDRHDSEDLAESNTPTREQRKQAKVAAAQEKARRRQEAKDAARQERLAVKQAKVAGKEEGVADRNVVETSTLDTSTLDATPVDAVTPGEHVDETTPVAAIEPGDDQIAAPEKANDTETNTGDSAAGAAHPFGPGHRLPSPAAPSTAAVHTSAPDVGGNPGRDRAAPTPATSKPARSGDPLTLDVVSHGNQREHTPGDEAAGATRRIARIDVSKLYADRVEEIVEATRPEIVARLIDGLTFGRQQHAERWLATLDDETLARVTPQDVDRAAQLLEEVSGTASPDQAVLHDLEVEIRTQPVRITFATESPRLVDATPSTDVEEEITARRDNPFAGLFTKSGRQRRREKRLRSRTRRAAVRAERARARLERQQARQQERRRRSDEKDQERLRRDAAREAGMSLSERLQERRMARAARRELRTEFREREKLRIQELRQVERELKDNIRTSKRQGKVRPAAPSAPGGRQLRRREREVTRVEKDLDRQERDSARESARERSRVDKKLDKAIARQRRQAEREASRVAKSTSSRQAEARRFEEDLEASTLRTDSVETKERLKSMKRMAREGARLERVQARARKRAERSDRKAQSAADKSHRREQAQRRVEEKAARSRERMLAREAAKINKRASKVKGLVVDPANPALPSAGPRYDWNIEAGILTGAAPGHDIDPAAFDLPEGLPSRG